MLIGTTMNVISKIVNVLLSLFKELINSKKNSQNLEQELNKSEEQQMKPTEVHQISRFSFSKTSLKRLEGVDDRLVKVTTTALTKYAQVDFGVSSGVRTI